MIWIQVLLGILLIVIILLEFVQHQWIKKDANNHEQWSYHDIKLWLNTYEEIEVKEDQHYSCNSIDQSISIIKKENYTIQDRLSIAHELGHAHTFRSIKTSIILKLFIALKMGLYGLLILSLLSGVVSFFFPKGYLILKWLLVLLTLVQILHWLMVVFMEVWANFWVKQHIKLSKIDNVALNLAVINQSLYWLLFLMLSIILCGVLIVKTS
ncbi:hypothetical protein ERUR111494_05105 [Erysipelothrix urinaevulpis]|uniref:hypothetical protein n=1 Tax=Erysipelothrix urinaevulpis TaxID=2683717 RepID=UPI0013569E3F|nr:hypothetical protein [Erysipelothrix urinaevulpis]